MGDLGPEATFGGRLRTNIRRLKNILTARLAGRWPALADRLVSFYSPAASVRDVPWTPVKKKLADSTIAVVTTAGIHHKRQKPFDMNDPDGDPTFRILDPVSIGSDYTITHDYYDHRNADRDINIVFPIDRLEEMKAAGFIGGISKRHFSFMGHITGPHILDLIENRAPRIVEMLREDRADAVLLTPG
jgi:D-proline reductase (dithiol) PrdB